MAGLYPRNYRSHRAEPNQLRRASYRYEYKHLYQSGILTPKNVAIQVGKSRRPFRSYLAFFTNLIDNEYSQNPISHAEYFSELEAVYHNSDIVVPLTYNDPGEGSNFINGTVGQLTMYLTSQLIPPYRALSISMGKYHNFC
jgi:hypothetical protein